MLTLQQCREILEKDHPDSELSDKQVEQIRDFFYLMAEIEMEPTLGEMETILLSKE